MGQRQLDESAPHLLKYTTAGTDMAGRSVASLCQGQQHLCGFGRAAQWWSASPSHP